MQWWLSIPDIVLGRLPGKELKELIEMECDDLEKNIKRHVNAARKNMGLEVMKEDGTDEATGEGEEGQQGPLDQEVP